MAVACGTSMDVLHASTGSGVGASGWSSRRSCRACAVSTSEKINGLAAELEVPEAKSFIQDVSSLVKLVNLKDIAQLELKHKNYEITIKKASSEPSVAAAVATEVYAPYFQQHFAAPPPLPPAAPPAPAATAALAPAAAPIVEAAAPAHPPMISPMSGTFYRSPGPDQPAFVKVGDTVKKGQTLCIIEAMKLMNTIECEQDGTLLEILVEDGSPITSDTPLFVIKP